MSQRAVTDPGAESCTSVRESAEAPNCLKRKAAISSSPPADASQHLTLILSHDYAHLLFPFRVALT